MTGYIHIHQGNRLEELATGLGELLQKRRRQNFSLEPDVILVNNFEMAQWLSIHIAQEQGICANVQFRLTGSFAWDLAGGLMEDDPAPLTRQRLRWVVFRCLQDVASGESTEGLQELEDYVRRQGEKGIYHLSGLLADLFDRYLNYRLDMLQQWEEGCPEEKHGWQPGFWRLLSRRTRGRLKVSYLRQLAEQLHSGSGASGVPGALYLFGISYLPPLHLDLLSALSGVADTHMFILNPCRRYWLDTVSERKRAALKRRLDPETVEGLFPSGNRLLASLGHAGRSFLARLYSYPVSEGRGLFVRAGREQGGSLLARIQDDILELRQGRKGPEDKRILHETDRSIVVHSCYSRLREVECLHDYLVGLFDQEEDLYPHDVIVMAPSIEEYAPLVEAVFGAAPEERFIPFSIADRGLGNTDPHTRAFLSVFTSPLKDFTAPALMDILSQPCVMKRFGIDQEGLSVLRKWVKKANIRRGIGTVSGAGGARQNSWIFGIDRLFVTMCMDKASLSASREAIVPVDFPIEGGQAELLAGLSAFFFSLEEFYRKVSAASGLSPDQWLEAFGSILETFISGEPAADKRVASLLERLEGLVDGMKDAGVESTGYETMCTILSDELKRPPPPRAYISGNVLFSSLVPMRSIPFRVICLLGMNDADFPRRPDVPSFDLMAGDWRPGDRVPREEDRYLFLETLISARERLLISYVGRRERDDAPQNPSVVVSELMDYIRDEFRPEHQGSPEDHILVEHPLQPFSTRYRETGSASRGLFTFAAEWTGFDQTGRPASRVQPVPFCHPALPLSEQEREGFASMTPGQMASFFQNPAKFFLKNRLNINVYIANQALEDREPFSISSEAGEIFLKMLLAVAETGIQELRNQPLDFIEGVYRHLRSTGEIPIGLLGKILWQRKCEKEFLPFIEKKFLPSGIPGEAVSSDIFLPWEEGDLRVTGNVGRTGKTGGLLEYRLSVNDSHKVAFWVRHLMLMLSGKDLEEEASSILVNLKTPVEIGTLHPDEAEELLESLAGLFMEGIRKPLPFFPAASWDFAKRFQKGRDEREASGKAAEKLFCWQNPSAIKDHWISYVYRGQASLLRQVVKGREFIRLSNTLCQPFLAHLKRGR